jgi:ferredoxin
VQYAPEVFEFDVDGLAYVKNEAGEMQLTAGALVDVPAHLRLEVIDAAAECPGECIHLHRVGDSHQLSEEERTQARVESSQQGASR